MRTYAVGFENIFFWEYVQKAHEMIGIIEGAGDEELENIMSYIANMQDFTNPVFAGELYECFKGLYTPIE